MEDGCKGERLEARDWKRIEIRSSSGLHNQEVGGGGAVREERLDFLAPGLSFFD